MNTTFLPFILYLFVTGCSVAVTGLCTSCGVATVGDASLTDAAPPDGAVLADGSPVPDSSLPDGGVAPDSSSDVDAGPVDTDLGTDASTDTDAGPPPVDAGPPTHCAPGEVGHAGFCYYETTWTGITVSPRQNCYASGGTPVEWRTIDEQHVLETYIPGPSDTVGVGLYDANPPHGEWSWLSDMSIATVDWLAFPSSGEQAALTGAGAVGISTSAMFMFCVKPGM